MKTQLMEYFGAKNGIRIFDSWKCKLTASECPMLQVLRSFPYKQLSARDTLKITSTYGLLTITIIIILRLGFNKTSRMFNIGSRAASS